MQVPEAKLYEQFVDRTLREVTLGLDLDNAFPGSKKRKVREALVRRSQAPDGPRGAAQKIIEARFMLGGDDASYIASGLACLWSTVGVNDANEQALTLAPSSLYAPDAVNGIRQGLLRALERRNADAQKEAPKRLPMLLRLLHTIVDFVPDVPADTVKLLRNGVVRSARERGMVMAFLKSLKEIMADAGDSTEDPETNLARRILKSSTAGSRASVERIRRIEEVEQANTALMEQYNAKQAEWKANVEQQRTEYLIKLKKEEIRLEKEFEARTEWAEHDKINELKMKMAATVKIAKDKDDEITTQAQKVVERDNEIDQLKQDRARLRSINEQNKEAAAAEARATAAKEAALRDKKRALAEKEQALRDASAAAALVADAEARATAAETAREGMSAVNAQKQKAERMALTALEEARQQRNAAQQEATDAVAKLKEYEKSLGELAAQAKGLRDELKECETRLVAAREERDKVQVGASLAAKDAREAAIAAKQVADETLEALQKQMREGCDALAQKVQEELAKKEAEWDAEAEELEQRAQAKERELTVAWEAGKAAQEELTLSLAEKTALQKQFDVDLEKARADLEAQIVALKAKQEKDASQANVDMLRELGVERAKVEVAHAVIEARTQQQKVAAESVAALSRELEKARADEKALQKEMADALQQKEREAADVLALREADLEAKNAELRAAERQLEEITEEAAKESRKQAEALAKAEEECAAQMIPTADLLANTTENYETLLSAQLIETRAEIKAKGWKIVDVRMELKDTRQEHGQKMQAELAAIRADKERSPAQKKADTAALQVKHREVVNRAEEESQKEVAILQQELDKLQEHLRNTTERLNAIQKPNLPPPPSPPLVGARLNDPVTLRTPSRRPPPPPTPALHTPSTLPPPPDEFYYDGKQQQIRAQLEQLSSRGEDATRPLIGVHNDDDKCDLYNSFVPCAIIRGLVGQRAPTEPESSTCAHDNLLPYALPELNEFVKRMAPVRSLLESSPDPTADELDDALAPQTAKRQRTTTAESASPAVVAEALECFGDNFAIIDRTPVAELGPEREGVEVPHQVRWMPQGPRAETMARVAVLEHAVARCTQLADHADTGEEAAGALRRAGAALKFQQMEDLYALNEAAEFDDDPHPLGTAERLVTRPCAMVRGVLSYPTDPGVQRIAADRAPEQALTDRNNLASAMSNNAVATATLRNELRRKGLPSHFYVAPSPEQLAFVPAAARTGGAAFSKPPTDGIPIVEGAATNDADAAQAVQNVEDSEKAAAEAEAAKETADALQASKEKLPLLEEAAAGEADQVPADEALIDLVLAASAPEAEEAEAEAPSRTWGQYAAEKGAEASEAHAFRQEAQRAKEKRRGALASERLRPSDYSTETWSRVINRAIVSTAALSFDDGSDPCPDATAAFLEMNKSGGDEVTAQGRRDGLWAEMHRHVAISQDRLWIFLRMLSGSIGGDVTEVITMANEATLKASKAIQEQRTEIAKRVSDMQSKIVEVVVSSMLRNSSMTMDYKDDGLAVVDAEARKNLKDLAAGTSARPFFEANVALKNLTESPSAPPTLREVLSGLANVGVQMQGTLEQTLSDPGSASASLVELSHPSNCYFVSMKPDAVAAIRSAHEMLNSELGAHHVRRRLTLWELVEGGCQMLTHRFAELCGFLLVQARTSTGVSAMYVSHQSIYTNASQARVALAKLLAAASLYAERVPLPLYDGADTQGERSRALVHGERIADIDLTRPRALSREPLYAPISASGYWVVGARRR